VKLLHGAFVLAFVYSKCSIDETEPEKIFTTFNFPTVFKTAHAALRKYNYTGFFVVEDMDLRPTIQAWIVNPTTVTTQAYKQIVSVPNMGVVTQGIYKGSILEQHFLEGSSLLKGSKAREVLFQVEFNPWIKWQNHYADIRSVEEVGGEEKIVFKSLIEGETGTVSYFDFETHLLNRLEMMINQIPSTFVYEDYREINVVLIAHHVKIKRELFWRCAMKHSILMWTSPKKSLHCPQPLRR
jgi:hypothetical protein